MGSGRRGMGRGTRRRVTVAKRSKKGTAGTLPPGLSPLVPGTPQKIRGQVSAQKEISTLKAQARAMEDQLLAIRARITELDRGRAISPVVAVVDRDKCIACGICQEICPTGAISIDEIARIDPMKCMGCGECVAQCPEEAIYLQKA
ncbi:MAG: 4Fe-4S binding protein [Desulfobacterales bacterium]|nr:4Fe-4S binding protein [Desulfobacterales bacterium]